MFRRQILKGAALGALLGARVPVAFAAAGAGDASAPTRGRA